MNNTDASPRKELPQFKKVFTVAPQEVSYMLTVYLIFSLSGYHQAVAEFFEPSDNLSVRAPDAFPCLLQFESIRCGVAEDIAKISEIDSSAFLARLDLPEIADVLIGSEPITLQNLLGAWARDEYDA